MYRGLTIRYAHTEFVKYDDPSKLACSFLTNLDPEIPNIPHTRAEVFRSEKLQTLTSQHKKRHPDVRQWLNLESERRQ